MTRTSAGFATPHNLGNNSLVNRTSRAVKGTPSCQRTSVRRLNVHSR